jgi:hypothetical protein
VNQANTQNERRWLRSKRGRGSGFKKMLLCYRQDWSPHEAPDPELDTVRRHTLLPAAAVRTLQQKNERETNAKSSFKRSHVDRIKVRNVQKAGKIMAPNLEHNSVRTVHPQPETGSRRTAKRTAYRVTKPTQRWQSHATCCMYWAYAAACGSTCCCCCTYWP